MLQNKPVPNPTQIINQKHVERVQIPVNAWFSRKVFPPDQVADVKIDEHGAMREGATMERTTIRGQPRETIELYRDSFGVPHIFARSVEGAYFGLGFCAAQDRPESLILHQYIVQGRLAEKIGRRPLTDPLLTVLGGIRRTPLFSEWAPNAWQFDDTVDVDHWMRVCGYWDSAPAQFATLDERSRLIIEAFARGVNSYFETRGAPEYAEPYDPITEVAWWAYFEHHVAISFFASNAFAVGSERSADGASWLGGDPHYWFFDGWSEAHLKSEEFELTGIWDGHVNLGMWGGTNLHIAMAVTAAGLEGASVYCEYLDPNDRDRYWSARDNSYQPVSHHEEVIKVAGEDAAHLIVRRTHHGPIVAEEVRRGTPVAFSIRSAFTESPAASLAQHLSMWQTRSVDEFLQYAQESEFVRGHRLVADREGNIGYVCNGPAAVRDPDIDWSKPVDSRLPNSEWGSEMWRPGAADYALPILKNPKAGFLQSANDPPWVTTIPSPVSDSYPKYLFPDGWRELGTRGARQRQVLHGSKQVGKDELTELVLDVYVPAAHLGLQALRARADQDGLLGNCLRPGLAAIDRVLGNWDGMATVDSVGMTLAFFLSRALPDGIPDPRIRITDDPDGEPEILPPEVSSSQAAAYVAALANVAETIKELYDGDFKAWGEVHGVDRDEGMVPLPGGCNELRALSGAWSGWWYGRDHLEADGTERCDFGTRHVRLTRLSPDGVEVYSVSVTGQFPLAEHPGSRHGTDQTELYARRELKRVPLTLSDIQSELAESTDKGSNYEPHLTIALV